MVKSSQKSEGVKWTEQSCLTSNVSFYTIQMLDFRTTVPPSVFVMYWQLQNPLALLFIQACFPLKGKAILPGHTYFFHIRFQNLNFFVSVSFGDLFVLLVTSLCWASCGHYKFITFPLPPTPLFFFYILCLMTATECPLPDTGYWHSCSFSLTQNNFFVCVCVCHYKSYKSWNPD